MHFTNFKVNQIGNLQIQIDMDYYEDLIQDIDD